MGIPPRRELLPKEYKWKLIDSTEQLVYAITVSILQTIVASRVTAFVSFLAPCSRRWLEHLPFQFLHHGAVNAAGTPLVNLA
ncbi:hypothetical protein Tco_1458999 [Tanacetum coccineum]